MEAQSPRHVNELFAIPGRIALVTGGSRGLGLQIAEALGEAGATVVLTARRADELDSACRALASRGITAHAIAGDAADAEDIARVCRSTLEVHGHIDILVNNAGASWGAPAEEHPLASWDKVMNLNVRGVFVYSQTVARLCMIPRRAGRIVMVASIAGLAGNPPGLETVAYNTSKAAVLNMTRALAGEWGEHGITVNALAPGWFPSRMTAATLQAKGEQFLARVPLRRFGNDEDLKGAALLLASDAGRHITGQVLAVDGGTSAIQG
ncbi:MAG: SDR family oxidoreductase [Proteobacteria bacterium]|nr:SDR family oxidoreductase [Pseudomonadota bacterium]